MKKSLILLIAVISLSLGSYRSSAQPTVAMDFNRVDCYGTMRHLFADLDSGNIVVLEFFMDSCNFCVNAAHPLESMERNLKNHYGVNIVAYAIGYTDVYPKSQIANWVSVNNLRSIPMDSGHTMVNYYGGFGMPTVVILGGRDHRVLYDARGFLKSDTPAAAAAVVSYVSGVNDISATLSSLTVYPNPASGSLNIEMTLTQNEPISMSFINMIRQIVASLPEEKVKAGKYNRTIDLSDLPTGNYVLRISSPQGAISRNISVVK